MAKIDVINGPHSEVLVPLDYDAGAKKVADELAEKTARLAAKTLIAEKDALLAGKDALLVDKNALLADKNALLAEKTTQLEDAQNERTCGICLDRKKEVVFPCGHTSCWQCSLTLVKCHICRKGIRCKLRFY